MGNEEKAIKLEHYIGNFIPTTWREPIKVPCFIPKIDGFDYSSMEVAFKNGKLISFLKTHPRLKTWYFMQAIENYFIEQEK